MRQAGGLDEMSGSREEVSLKPSGSSADRNGHLLGTVVFFGLLALTTLVAIPYGTVEPWWQALFECVVFGLAALSLIEFLLRGSLKFFSYSLLWPLLALIAFAFLQTLPLGGSDHGVVAISADPHGTRRWIVKMLALILVGAMLLRYTSDRRRLRTLVYLVLGIALASAIFGLLRQMTQQQDGFFLPNLHPGFGYGQFFNKNHFPFLMEMAIGLVLGLMVWRGLPRDRLLLSLGVVVLLGGALVLSNSRGGILSLFCQLLFAALLFTGVDQVRDSATLRNGLIRTAQRFGASFAGRALLIVCFALVITIGIVWLGGAPLAGSLETMPGEVTAQTDSTRWAVRRRDIWSTTWQLIKAHPVTGTGFGGYWMAITAYHDASGEMTPQEAHNDYLEFLAGGGLIGVALGGWFLYALIRGVRGRLHTSDRFVRAARCGAIVGLTGVAIHSFVDFGLHVAINAVVFVILVVIATVNLPEGEPLAADLS